MGILSLLMSSKFGIANLDNGFAIGEIANIGNVFRLWQSSTVCVRISSLLVSSKVRIAALDKGCAVSKVANIGPVFIHGMGVLLIVERRCLIKGVSEEACS